ncbi:MAG TPA: zinc-ribbon domain-containing protein [Microlunatus sp.]|nr:zinc-ribbon domain-containing protein [Microlunatus sp.]
MQCPRCRSQVPDVAHFCQVCGQDLRSDDRSRRRSFAAKPDEPVASFALISSIMPRGTAGQQPQTYRIAFGIGLVVAVVAAIFGALPIAVLVAAFTIPIVYIVYLYDVNLWEDEPIPVTALAFGLTGLLATLFTLLWTAIVPLTVSLSDVDGFVIGAPTVGTFLIIAVAVPVIGEVIRQIGPLVLASRPRFDDLMDGLTFGVISGVAYACFDTLVRHWALLTGGIVQVDPGHWVGLIFLEGFIKPLIMGTATGIACAEFSGLGRGYDGFTPRYFGGLVAAIVANIAYQSGGYLFSFVGSPTLGTTLQILWALIILGALLLRVRVVLHTGLMEAALEQAARAGTAGPSGEIDFCAHCEMPLLDHASFCNACGTAVRAQAKAPRSVVPVAVGAPDGAAAGAHPGGGDPGPAPASSPSYGSADAELAGPIETGPVVATTPTGSQTTLGARPGAAPYVPTGQVPGAPDQTAADDEVYDQFAEGTGNPPPPAGPRDQEQEGRS